MKKLLNFILISFLLLIPVAIATVTVDGVKQLRVSSLIAEADLDIGDYGFRAQTLTADGLTPGRLIVAGANGLLSDATVTESSGALGGITTLGMSGLFTTTGKITESHTFTATTAGEEIFKITSTDASVQSAGMNRTFVVAHTITGAKSGTASSEGISCDIALNAATNSIYGYGAYISESGNNAHGNIFGFDIYLEDMGSGGIANLAGLNIGINSTNTATSRHTGLRIRNHSGVATNAILIESAFVDGLDLSGGTFSGADIRLQNGETISNAVDGTINFDAADLITTGGLTCTDITASGAVNINTTDGIDIYGGSDTDHDLITVGVTGTPKLWWDESENGFVVTASGLDVVTDVGATYISGTGMKTNRSAAYFGNWQDGQEFRIISDEFRLYNRANDVEYLTVTGGDFGFNETLPDEKLQVGGNIHLDDNYNMIFGTGKDATIDYNNADLICKPDAVGIGKLIITGEDDRGHELLQIDQNDIDQAFIDFDGDDTIPADVTEHLSILGIDQDSGAGTVAAPDHANWDCKCMIKIEINGAAYWIPAYQPN